MREQRQGLASAFEDELRCFFEVEDDLYVAVTAGGARGGDGLAVLAQLKALYTLALILFKAVGVRTSELRLLVPEGGEIQATPRRRHADKCHLPTWTDQARRVLDRTRSTHALEDLIRPSHDHRLSKLGGVTLPAEQRGQLLIQFPRVHDLVRPEAQSLLLLPLVFGDAD